MANQTFAICHLQIGLPMSDIRSGIEKRARKAIVQYAFLRWENAVIIGMVMLLTFFWQKPFPG